LQAVRARQMASAAPNERIDRFDSIGSRFFPFRERIPEKATGRALDEKVARAFSISLDHTL
jgi:hypothetical protein